MDADLELLADALSAYELGEEIGRGAGGIVVAARHRSLGREVAVKRLPPVHRSDRGLRSRFLSEARVLASLDHPHIVPIFDFVESDGVCALVMERLHGGSVWDRFRAEGFIGPAACAVVLATALALHYAHGKGVLHRDVKPPNLMFSGEDVLKVTDFGIAKVISGSQPGLTQDGAMLGTPAYMAPEQVKGEELGPPTDVYAAGTVLYELLCGRAPFPPVEGPLAELHQRLSENPVGLLERDPGAPAALADVTARALARDPRDRYQSALELAIAIDEAASREWGSGWVADTGVVVRDSVTKAARAAPAPAGEGPASTTAIRLETLNRSGVVEPPASARDRDLLAAAALRRAQGPGEALYAAGADDDLRGLLEEALAAVDGEESVVRVRLLARLAVELHLTGSVDRRDALSREAVELAARLGDGSLELLALYSRLTATWSPDGLEARLAGADLIVRRARALDDQKMAYRGRRLRLRALLEAGDLDEADREIAVLDGIAEGSSEDGWRWQTSLLRAMRALHAGQADDAERLALDAYAIGRDHDESLARRLLDPQIAWHRWLVGRKRELVPLLREAYERSPWMAIRGAALIFGLVELDRRTEAIAELERLAGDSFDAVPYDGNWLQTMAFLSVVCARLGDERRTELLYKALQPFADRIAICGDCAVIGPPIAAVLGILAAARSRFDSAGRHFERALQRAAASGAVAHASFTRCEYARMLIARRHAGDAEHAEALLQQAVTTARERGLAGLAARAQAVQAARH